MPKIFLSYRRDDSAYVTGMLADRLQEVFGRNSVFLDIDNIPFGVDFRVQVSQAVGECDILLAIIGDSWIATESEDGERRIDMPTDFVRLEIESALQRNIPVVPVLVGNARMPTENELPESLSSLAYRNAAELRPGRDLQHHVGLLIRGIANLIPKSASPDVTGRPPGPPTAHDHASGARNHTPRWTLSRILGILLRVVLGYLFICSLMMSFALMMDQASGYGPDQRPIAFAFFIGAMMIALLWWFGLRRKK